MYMSSSLKLAAVFLASVHTAFALCPDGVPGSALEDTARVCVFRTPNLDDVQDCESSTDTCADSATFRGKAFKLSTTTCDNPGANPKCP
ncbi:hypothetical protein LZ30DRAFT_697757 [Colletotrichum cereale]|nr:hypothetical protein LZ30DRAFT_697757 [Colletotrichum cereale]